MFAKDKIFFAFQSVHTCPVTYATSFLLGTGETDLLPSSSVEVNVSRTSAYSAAYDIVERYLIKHEIRVYFTFIMCMLYMLGTCQGGAFGSSTRQVQFDLCCP